MSGLEFTDAAAKRLEKLYLTKDVIDQRSETLRQLALVKGEHVLDIGSGPGFLCESIAALVGSEGAVVGIEISPDLVAVCERRNQPKCLSFSVGDATKIDRPDAAGAAAASLSRPQRDGRGMHRRGQLLRIEILPRATVVANEVAAAPPAKHFRVFNTGRQHVVVAQRMRRHQQAPAGARDRLVRRRQVLEGVIGDRPHALGDRLVLLSAWH